MEAPKWIKIRVLFRVKLDPANHTIGKSYVAYMFYRHGYAIKLVYLANEHEDRDGFAVEIYKPDERR
jgi:hypothetical protein